MGLHIQSGSVIEQIIEVHPRLEVAVSPVTQATPLHRGYDLSNSQYSLELYS